MEKHTTEHTAPVKPPVHHQPTPPVATPSHSQTDVLGIISIGLACLVLNVPGLIVGLIGASKAKHLKLSPIISRIGWILNLVALVITVVLVGLLVVYGVTHPDEVKDATSDSQSADMPKTRNILVKGFSLDVPVDFTSNSTENPSADYAEGNGARGVYVSVFSTPLADVSPQTTPNDYADSNFKALVADTNFSNPSRSLLAEGTIANPNKYNAVDYRMDAQSGVNKYVYLDRYIKGKNGYYMISASTTPSKFEANSAVMKKIIASFRESNS